MPYTIVESDTLLTVSLTGVISNSEFTRLFSALRPIVAANPDVDELVDLTGVLSFEVSSATVRDIAHHPIQFSGESRQAFVAPADHIFGMLRMLQLMIEPDRPNLMIFRTMESAYMWVNRAEEQTG